MKIKRRINNNRGFDKGQILLFIICLCLLLGALVGAFGANNLDEIQSNELGKYLNDFLNSIKNEGYVSGATMGNTMIKHGKYIFLMWICGFLSTGIIFITLIIIFKGISYGFSTAFLVKQFSKQGMVFAATACLPQNIILIPLYIITAYVSCKFVLGKYRKRSSPKSNLKREKNRIVIEYTILLAGAVIFLTAASAVEVYAVPFLVKFLAC